jgi:hypothetical protein
MIFAKTHISDKHYINPEGKVISVSSKGARYLKCSPQGKGYPRLTVNGKHFYIHRLVATLFVPNPDNKPCVNHIDGNKCNNHYSNLEWLTQAENNRHAIDTGLKPPSYMGVLDEKTVKEVYNLKDKATAYSVAKKYQITKSSVKCIWRRITYKYYTE